MSKLKGMSKLTSEVPPAAEVLAGRASTSSHSQRCPVARGAAVADCDCWVLRDAQKGIEDLYEAGYVVSWRGIPRSLQRILDREE